MDQAAREKVIVQYKDASNLDARLALHARFSTSKQNWARWVFDQLTLSDGERILELGCGNGNLWKQNNERLPDCEITLSDFSEGMLADARASIGAAGAGFAYKVIDAQAIPYEAGSLDVVIANHMLYHVADRQKAISEISRVLKPGGRFFAATNGLRHMAELVELVEGFDSSIHYAINAAAEAFGLENGAEQLSQCFNTVEMLRPKPNRLVVTEAQPLADYVLSSGMLTNIREIITPDRIPTFIEYIGSIIRRNGIVTIHTDGGMFLARN